MPTTNIFRIIVIPITTIIVFKENCVEYHQQHQPKPKTTTTTTTIVDSISSITSSSFASLHSVHSIHSMHSSIPPLLHYPFPSVSIFPFPFPSIHPSMHACMHSFIHSFVHSDARAGHPAPWRAPAYSMSWPALGQVQLNIKDINQVRCKPPQARPDLLPHGRPKTLNMRSAAKLHLTRRSEDSALTVVRKEA